MKHLKFYFRLFLSTFSLSAFTFGGGYVIVPLMRKKFVEEYHWIDEQEMLDLTAIAQSAPGPIAVNASILVGYRLSGILGSAVAILGTVFPPFIILSIVSLAYTEFRDSLIIGYILKGMQAGVAAIIIDVVLSMMKELLKERKKIPDLIMIGAFISSFVLDVNVIYIIIASGSIGLFCMYFLPHIKKGGEDK